MMDNHHEILIHKNDSFVGTGHNSEIVSDNAGTDWLFYHAVSVANPDGRVLMLDKIDWIDGWPSVKVTHLLSSQKNHVFKKGDNYDYSQVVIINSFCFFNCRLRIF